MNRKEGRLFLPLFRVPLSRKNECIGAFAHNFSRQTCHAIKGVIVFRYSVIPPRQGTQRNVRNQEIMQCSFLPQRERSVLQLSFEINTKNENVTANYSLNYRVIPFCLSKERAPLRPIVATRLAICPVPSELARDKLRDLSSILQLRPRRRCRQPNASALANFPNDRSASLEHFVLESRNNRTTLPRARIARTARRTRPKLVPASWRTARKALFLRCRPLCAGSTF